MNFKFQISNFKYQIFIVLMLVFGFWFLVLPLNQKVHADAVTDSALNFLRSKQDADGRITTGFSAPSQWSAIALAINNVDAATVKAYDKSLFDFLLSDLPTNNAPTDWENRILAIVAIGGNPTDFGGTNYVANLESFYNNGQIGDTCSVNDDVFGMLALISSGSTSSTQIKQDTLNFLIIKQDAVDGGFGFSAPGCDWYGTSADMTAAAIQAFVTAKENGLANDGLDNAIDRAKNYLLVNQNVDGGFGYYGSSDSDTTGWVLQAFNVLGLKDSDQAIAARNYLLVQQSGTDGGFIAFDWGTSTFVSNATTTAQAVIALSGKGWVIKTFDPSAPSPTITVEPTQTPTPVPTSSPSNNSSSNSSPTNTPTPTPTNTPAPTPIIIASNLVDDNPTPTDIPEENTAINPTTAPQPEVLGAKDENKNNLIIAWFFVGLGAVFVFIYLAKTFIIKK